MSMERIYLSGWIFQMMKGSLVEEVSWGNVSTMRCKAQVKGDIFKRTERELNFGGHVKELVNYFIDVDFFHKCLIFNFSWLTHRLKSLWCMLRNLHEKMLKWHICCLVNHVSKSFRLIYKTSFYAYHWG